MFFEDLKYLWLLAFALIPLIIHLINRGNRSIVNVGSLDWLTQKQFKQSKRLLFQQFTLWILRTVVFLLIAFIVIKPFLLNNKKVDNKHLLLVKEDVSKQVLTNVMDTITLDEWNVKWLNWDLNDVDLKLKNTINTKAIHPFKAFELVEYKNINPLSVMVLGSYNQHQLKFKFPDVSFSVNWLLLPFENEHRISEVGLVKRDRKSEILEIDQNEFLSKVISYEKEDSNLDLPVINFNIDTIVVAFDKKKYEPLVKVLDAALKAVIEYQEMSTTILNQKADELTIDLKANLLFWLSDSKIYDFKIKSLQNTYVYKEELNKYSYVKVSDKVTLKSTMKYLTNR